MSGPVEFIKNHADTAVLSAGMLVSNVIGTEELTVYSSDSASKQAALAIPSALPAAEVFGNKPADIAWQIGYSALGLEAVKTTTSLKAIGAMAVASQVLSSAVDAAVDRSGWLTEAERAQPDVGFSAIFAAWATKFLLDRAASATTKRTKRLWQAASGLFVAGMTAGVYLIEGPNDGKVDVAAHASGIAVGGLGYLLGNWRKIHKSSDLAASESYLGPAQTE